MCPVNEHISLYLDLQQVVASDSIPARETMELWIKAALSEVALSGESEQSQKLLNNEYELTLRIVNKNEIQTLNKTYRHKDKPTNVLSFPFEAPAQVQLPLLGDVVICHDVVLEEAHQQQKTIENHWAHMVIHGVLHLIGYDHMDDSEAQSMENLEIQILNKLNIADPYR
ncbi:MAG: rRNA maturation RNase YbeY [Gammaproteobacteria bacterium]|nr:rRNA maturation RNase YbeY [Gammaproteobacteria bacterium]